MTGVAVLIALMFGVGLYAIVSAPIAWTGRRVLQRLEPYLSPRRATPESLAHRVLGAARMRSIAARQQRAGRAVDPVAHLLDIAMAAGIGILIGIAALAAMFATGRLRQPVAAMMLMLMCAASGWLIAERRLDAAAHRRRDRAAHDLPGVAETLAIAVSAGAALPHALELVAQRGDGPLVEEIGHVVDDIRADLGVDVALAALQSRMPVASVTRFVDALRIALERGTPIVDVLHAQASDARNESRRLLLEQAGRREIAMLLPVVFFVLPAVIVVALFPGFTELAAMAQPL